MTYWAWRLPDFALQAVRYTDPNPGRGPEALTVERARTTLLEACNEAARAAGVEPGLSVSRALARCPGLRLVSRSVSAEKRLDAWLRAAAWRHSPYVESTRPGTVVLRDPVAFLPDTVSRAPEIDLRRGGGPTPDLAELATGLTCAAAPEIRVAGPEDLDRLPLAHLGLSEETEAVLESWGLRDCGAFRRLSREQVAGRLGPAAAGAWDRLSGREVRPLRIAQPPRRFAAELALEYAIETLEPLLFLLRRLFDELSMALEAAVKVAAAIHLRLALENGPPPYLRTFRLPEPTRRPEILLRAVHTVLEALRLEHRVVGVALRIVPAPERPSQRDMLTAELSDPHRFNETLACLAALVGPEALGTPACRDTHRPDAIVLRPLGSVRPPAGNPESGSPKHEYRGYSLDRFRPPRRVSVSVRAGRPYAVESLFCRGRVVAARGPWHGSGEWWERLRYWREVEWDVQLENGMLLRLIRSGRNWHLAGIYR